MTKPSEREAAEPAVAPGDDPRAFAAVLRAVHEAAMAGDPLPARPRSVIGESWLRVRSAGVDPDVALPSVVDPTDLPQRRSDSGLSPVLSALTSELEALTGTGDNIMVIADAEGRVLWRSGSRPVLRRADALGFVEGASWAEASVGTNAIGTALASGRAVQVFSAEHFVRSHHAWTCTGAPIRDPRTGSALGVVDVSGPAQTINSTTLALVGTVARLAEAQLRERHRDELDRLRSVAAPIMARAGVPALAVDPHGWVAAVDAVAPRERVRLPSSPAPGRSWLSDLGTCELDPLPGGGWLVRLSTEEPDETMIELDLHGSVPRVVISGGIGGWSHHPSPRHAQILDHLARHREGCSAAELAQLLFGDPARTITVRAEISRLRKHFGGLISANPYRFAAGVQVVVGAPAGC